MDVFKPIKRVFVPREKTEATLELPVEGAEAQPTQPDALIVEMQGDDGWLEWQNSVLVDEFTSDALQTVPGELK